MSEFSEMLVIWWRHPAIMWGVIFVGACVGSFLNVAIYRVPLGLSVNDPKRSFCPICKATLPWWQNLPVITWVVQRGKCAHCGAKIPFRYLLVEILSAVLFFFCWQFFSPLAGLLMMFFCAVLVVVSFIDAEHQVIPIILTTVASVVAVLLAFFGPVTLNLLGGASITGWHGLWQSILGWLVGFGSLWFVVIFGKLVFGRKKLTFAEAETWELIEPADDSQQLAFIIAGERYDWGELFFRKTDTLRVTGHGILVDGQRSKATELLIRADEIEFDGKKIVLENLKSLRGKATAVIIPREAMGMGDPHLLAMIGTFLAWPAVLFTIMASCFYAIAAAIVARVGFGRPLPYGPFLALGALTWVFGGWHWWAAYIELLEKGW